MRKINDLKIGLRLIIIISTTVVVILSALGVYIYQIQQEKIMGDTDTSLNEQVDDLCKIVQLQIQERREQVDVAIQVAQELLDLTGSIALSRNNTVDVVATNQETQQKKRLSIPLMMLNNTSMFNSTSFVDKITDLTHAKATVFQKIEGGYLRISTSVIQTDGKRATNTFIPDNSPVVQSIESGVDYNGRAIVVGDWYLTSYRPIRVDNKVVGMLFVGMPEKDMTNIKELFAKKKFLTSGYPFIVDKNGKFIVHPQNEGEDVKNQEFFRVLTNSGNNGVKTNYAWNGRNKILYARYVGDIESYISASIYEDELNNMLLKLRNILIVSVVLSIVLIILISAFIANSISSSIKKGVDFAKRISNGDLTAQLDIDQKDEIGVLADALRTMVESFRTGVDMAKKIASGDLKVDDSNGKNILEGSLDEALINMRQQLRNVVQNIRMVAQNVATGSNQISESATDISSGANEQAASAEEVSSSVEQMTATISQNTENAQDTERIAVKASKNIEEGRMAFETTLSAMKNIAEKISIIGDIAEKTDLLAINAAIEAARAGEHGKGFAVVASEVRKLAEISQNAARDINQLSSSSLVVAENASKLLSAIVPDVKKTAELVMEISAASQEQKAGADQINIAIQQFSNVTQSNTASAEEMASSSEELASQAEQLNEVVSYFKLEIEKNKGFQPKENKHSQKTDKKISRSAIFTHERELKCEGLEEFENF
jgi:methyl-accepting chemotaxis protein